MLTAAPTTVLKPVLDNSPSVLKSRTVSWHHDYGTAMTAAEEQKKMLLIVFTDRTSEVTQIPAIERQALQPALSKALDKHVLAKLPTNTTINIKGQSSKLIHNAAFSELRGGAGIAVIDLAHKETDYHKRVVNVLPFQSGKYYHFASSSVPTLLTLPPGTLTQRSMIYAVRIHPEAPQSTLGSLEPVLNDEATCHSLHQAAIQNQGHHNWGTRFERIRGRLAQFTGRASAPREVVAESWPNQDLMDSCVDCVHSWRQSDGHWNAVRGSHSSYAYDIRRGGNGIWYATGLFGD